MTKGDVITVYCDPITKKTIEGKAKLIKDTEERLDDLERWQVKFIGDDSYLETYRWINPQ